MILSREFEIFLKSFPYTKKTEVSYETLNEPIGLLGGRAGHAS